MNESRFVLEKASHAGMCAGVKRAVDMAKRAAAEYGGARTLGPIVHNKAVCDELARQNILPVDSLEQCPPELPLIIRSHGAGKAEHDRISALGLVFRDATCPFVKHLQQIAARYSAKGCDIVIAGEKTHPEVAGIAGWCAPDSTIIIGNSPEELEERLKAQEIFSKNAQICVAQTTFDNTIWTNCKNILRKYCTNPIFFDTICITTKLRQEQAAEMAARSALMIVLGDNESSNSRKLFDICAARTSTVFVRDAREIDPAGLILKAELSGRTQKILIGITAGASTPADNFEEVHSIMSTEIEQIKRNSPDLDSDAEEAADAAAAAAKEQGDIDFMAEVDRTFKRIYIGNRVKATVVAVNSKEASVDIGTKHAGYIPAHELTSDPAKLPGDIVQPGDIIDCVVTHINDAEGVVELSKKRVDAALGMEKIDGAWKTGESLDGTVTAVVKGGVIVVCDGARVFVPASQSGVPRTGKLDDLLKKTVKFKIIEVNESRSRVVGSIRAAVKEDNDIAKAKFWDEIFVGKRCVGEVKSIESYGVFVDFGGVDGMVHLSELTWNRIRHPKEVVSIGDRLDVYVKSFDPEKKRISLGAKNPDDNPWHKFAEDFAAGDIVDVQIVSITPFGAFAQIVPGVDGLIHISQISNDRVTNVAGVLSIGEVVRAQITEIDKDRSRVSLSIKAALNDGLEIETEPEISEIPEDKGETAEAEAAEAAVTIETAPETE